MPTALIGANVKGKPTFMTIAFCNMVSSNPPVFILASVKSHYTNIGIKDNKTFSVNFPSESQVKAADYCGIVSGHREDKSKIFHTFYGELKNAPMIEDCPLVMECKVLQSFELANNEIFTGEIVAGYCEEKYLTDGAPDLKKIKPIIYSWSDDYWKLGGNLGRAFSVGKDYRPK
jgi:flavin reductase (DIM6/NTAB) family NADH-FMN oxidoreductase RutF